MFKPEILKSKMVANNLTVDILSDKLGIDTATFSRKMGKKSEFKRSEMQLIRECLGLTKDDMDAIFFAQ